MSAQSSTIVVYLDRETIMQKVFVVVRSGKPTSVHSTRELAEQQAGQRVGILSKKGQIYELSVDVDVLRHNHPEYTSARDLLGANSGSLPPITGIGGGSLQP
jgi:hypothetical protein